MAKLQRRFITGAEYYIEGMAEGSRRLRFLGRGKISGKEVLIFRPLRKAAKVKP